MLKKTMTLVATAAIAIQLYLLMRVWLSRFFEIDIEQNVWLFILTLAGVILVSFLLAYLLIFLLMKVTGVVKNSIDRISVQEMVSGLLGMMVGLVIAILLGNSIYKLPVVGPYFYVIVAVFFAYLGWIIGVKRREELAYLVSGKFIKSLRSKTAGTSGTSSKLVDTSVIIDGRISDILQSGFIEGELVVPDFVLEELQKISDSSDSLKRNRGRRGLDILKKMQNEPGTSVRIDKTDYPDLTEVDAKLVRMAMEKEMPVLTNDYNLNKVAQLQGVKVLNINELANAVKPVVLPGEEFEITVIKEGKEAAQGIGYLDDGTMVVVEEGKKLVGKTINIVVTSVLQTSAGRMIFGKPK